MNIVSALLALLGAIGGVIIGQRLQARARKDEFDLVTRKELLTLRIGLIERLTSVLVKFGRVEAIYKMFEIEHAPESTRAQGDVVD